MPIVMPFRGLRYNPNKISFISRVVAPPYDVIQPELEEELLQRDPYNVVRLTLGKPPPRGRGDEDYRQAALALAAWRDAMVLVQDEEPCIYVVEQTFSLGGQHLSRLGFVAGLLLEDPGAGSIFPHERTMSAPRSDRFRLMAACHASFSQVMTLYSDPDGAIQQHVRGLREGHPTYSFRDSSDVGHRVWAVPQQEHIRALTDLLREQVMVIADGHHRYESALAYCRQHRRGGDPDGSLPTDFVPSFCVSVADCGLRSLPTHRRARSASGCLPDDALAPLDGLFDIQAAGAPNAESLQRAFDLARDGDQCVGCYLRGRRLLLLRPHDWDALQERLCEGVQANRNLPVNLLHCVVLPEVLGIPPGSLAEAELVDYRHEASAIFWGVESGDFDAGFLLPPTPLETVQKVAVEGERLPLKSTYFYPKIASGLVMHAHR